MKKIFSMTVLFVLFLFLIACGKQEDNDGSDKDGIVVVTTLFAPYDFANNIVSEEDSVSMLLSPGEETHSYEPTPQDMITLNKCDLFIYNGGENESWVNELLKSLDSDVQTICMMDTIESVYFEEHVEGMQGEHENYDESDEHETDEYDEHVWTAIDNAINISNEIADRLAAMNESKSDIYKNNAKTYTDRLAKLRDEISLTVRNSSKNTLIFGDRFPMRYFTEEYGLDYYAAFPGCSADTEASAATIKFLIDKAKEIDVKVIIKSEMSSGNIADTIAAETGAEVMTMYACHNISKDDYEAGVGYIELMERNHLVLKEALN